MRPSVRPRLAPPWRASFLELDDLPFVISGSGGDSRHFWLAADRPFASRKLAHSADKMTGADGKEHWVWEVELFGTGKQVAMPPSIHPDTGKPYVWGRALELDLLDVGLGPLIAADRVAAWAPEAGPPVDDDDGFEAQVRANPSALSAKEIADILAALPLADYCDDRDGWLTVGAALHHEFEGSAAGLKVSNDFIGSRPSSTRGTQARVWKSFGDSRRPTRMATLKKAAAQAKFMASEADNSFGDDVDLTIDGDDTDEIDDLLGGADEVDPEAWKQLLDLNEEGAIKPTLHNVTLMVRNDPRIAGLPRFNEFTQEVTLRSEPGRMKLPGRRRAKLAKQLTSPIWTPRDAVNGDMWSDCHDHAVRDLFKAPKFKAATA